MRIGSLCTGYGGLDMAAEAVTGGSVAWVSDTDKGAATLLAHRYPGVPNLGDLTLTDWTTVEPVDVLTAGFPCQPVSNAGKRLGDDDERWLWDDVHRAVRDLGPRLLLLENVRGLLTARGGRLFGRVVGTLADIGYDTRWAGVRAADIGAPHGRWRIFIAAYPAGTEWGGTEPDRVGAATGPAAEPRERPSTTPLLPTPRTSDTNGAGSHGDGGVDLRTAVTLLPTPISRDYKGSSQTRERGRPAGDMGLPEAVALLPTPAVNDMGEGKTPDAWDAWTARMAGSSGDLMLPSAVQAERWGAYAEAIQRWETIIGRPAPDPTMTSSKGNPQLAPAFVEWMMGLPAGWVTDVPGLTRNQMLKLCGNGVVPQQAAAAIRGLLA